MRHILITSRDEGHERLCITRYRSADFAGGISLMFRQSSAFPRIAVTNSNLRNYVEGGREERRRRNVHARGGFYVTYVLALCICRKSCTHQKLTCVILLLKKFFMSRLGCENYAFCFRSTYVPTREYVHVSVFLSLCLCPDSRESKYLK